MKKSEMRRALFDAVSSIDPALVQEATAPRRNKVMRIVWRAAAAAAVLALLIGAVAGLPGTEEEYVTGPGLLSIRAFALDEDEISDKNSIVMEEGVELPWEYVWSPGINIARGLPIKFDFPTAGYAGLEHMYISLDVSVTGGHFWREARHRYDPEKDEFIWDTYTNIGDNFTLNNGATVYWSMSSVEYDKSSGKYVFTGGLAPRISFVDIVIRADNIIIGYAVVKIYERLPPNQTEYIDGVNYGYLANVVEIVTFPQVDGNFQPVTKKYVEKKFEELHNSNK